MTGNFHTVPRCIAHRGDSQNYPENTRAAFEAALIVGADGIELDIQTSADGRVFVFHDASFSRMGYDSAPNTATPFHEIAERDVGSWFNSRFSDQGVLDVETLLSDFAGKTTLLIEIKTWLSTKNFAEKYVDLLHILKTATESKNSFSSIEVLCYSPEVLALAKKIDNRFKCVLNTDEEIKKDMFSHYRDIGIDVISAYIKNLNDSFAANIAGHGFPLYVFTCNRQEQVIKAMAAGAAAIMSDDPAWLIQQVRGKSEKK